MIRGYYRGEFPFIGAVVSFRDIASERRPIEFAVDSGAETSVVQLHDLRRLGLETGRFADRPSEINVGVGGEVRYRRVMAYLQFADNTDAPEGIRYRVALRIAEHDQPLLPSVVGLDILNAFKVTLLFRDGLVLLEERP